MKTKNASRFLILLSFFAVISCSKTEENVPIINFTDLILTSDSLDSVLIIDESISFTVTGDDGIVYNDQATFFVNNTEIVGSTYSFNTEGSYSVYASYGGVNSNTLDFDVFDANNIFVTISASKALRNQIIEFELVDNSGSNVTESATFFVNGSVLSSNTFSSASEGNFEVYAEYELAGETFTSETISFEVFIPKRKVVLEDYTGTWCGYCPRMNAAIENVRELTEDVVAIAIHSGSSIPDPMEFQFAGDLQDMFNVSGLPQGRINRTTNWVNPHTTNIPLSIAGTDTEMSIKISSQLTGTELLVEIKMISEVINSNNKLVVYLLEDGLHYDQTNYFNNDPTSPYYQQGNPIVNFEHNDVLRMSLTNIFGDAISETGVFEEYTVNLSKTILSSYNINNLHIVALIVDSDNNALNAQFAKVNENKDFE